MSSSHCLIVNKLMWFFLATSTRNAKKLISNLFLSSNVARNDVLVQREQICVFALFGLV